MLVFPGLVNQKGALPYKAMDKFIAGDRVILTKSDHRGPKTHIRSRREPLDKGVMEVVQVRFIACKHEGEARCKENGRIIDHWFPFHVLKRVGREGIPPETDTMAEARRVSRLTGLGVTITYPVSYDPRAEYLAAAELRAGKGTPYTWHYPNQDRKPYNPDELKEIAEKNKAWMEELASSPDARKEFRETINAFRRENS